MLPRLWSTLSLEILLIREEYGWKVLNVALAANVGAQDGDEPILKRDPGNLACGGFPKYETNLRFVICFGLPGFSD